MKFLSFSLLLLGFQCAPLQVSLPVQAPQQSSTPRGDSIAENFGDLIAKGALSFPNFTSSLLEDAIKVAFDNPNLAHDALQAIGEGAVEAVIKGDPHAISELFKYIEQGAIPVLSKAASDKLNQLKGKLHDISGAVATFLEKVFNDHDSTPSVPGTPSPDSQDQKVPTTSSEGDKPHRGWFGKAKDVIEKAIHKASSELDSLKHKVQEIKIQALNGTIKAVLESAHSERGHHLIEQVTKGATAETLSHPEKAQQVAKDIARVLAEEALSHPGTALTLARAAFSGAFPILQKQLVESVQHFVAHVTVLVQTAPSQGLIQVQKKSQELLDSLFGNHGNPKENVAVRIQNTMQILSKADQHDGQVVDMLHEALDIYKDVALVMATLPLELV